MLSDAEAGADHHDWGDYHVIGAPSPECGHPGCFSDDVEERARDAAAAVLGDDGLARVCEQEAKGVKPDFRSYRHALEVKQLTSPALRQFLAAHNDHLEDPHRPIEGLSQVWLVFADVSAAIESFDGKTKTPRADLLIDSLTPLLKDLEARGVTDAFGDDRVWSHMRTILGFQGHCSVIPGIDMKPGIFFSTSHGHSRTTYLEHDVVGFLEQWLHSRYAANARKSLAPERRKRVVVLVPTMDGPAAAMLRTLAETPGVNIPTTLRLPQEVDALIVTTDDEVIHFDPTVGWARHTVVSLGL